MYFEMYTLSAPMYHGAGKSIQSIKSLSNSNAIFIWIKEMALILDKSDFYIDISKVGNGEEVCSDMGTMENILDCHTPIIRAIMNGNVNLTLTDGMYDMFVTKDDRTRGVKDWIGREPILICADMGWCARIYNPFSWKGMTMIVRTGSS